MSDSESSLFDKKRLAYRVPEMADALGVAVSTLTKWVMRKKIPFVKVEGIILFQPEKIEAWLNERSHDAQR